MQHTIVSEDEWLAARKALLAKEKEFTKARDALSAARRALPWVKVEKRYCIRWTERQAKRLPNSSTGAASSIVYHFMFGPDWEAGCPHCSHWADNFNGIIVHLNQRDVTMVAVSRAPYAKLAAYEKRMGWTFKWLSSLETEFNFDFHVSFTPEEVAAKDALYNFQRQDPLSPSAKASACFSRIPPAPCSTPIRPMRAASTC